MSVKSSVSLTEEQTRFIQSQVKAGRFASFSAFVQQSVELMRQKTEANSLETEALRNLLEERAGGTFINPDEIDDRLNSMFGEKRTNNDA